MGLHVVTGKGGVGKTTVALGLARALAADGSAVLACEVEGRAGLPRVAGLPTGEPGVEAPLGELTHLDVDARAALTEYLDRHLRVGLASRALERAGFVDLATSIAPGLRDILVLGRIYQADRDGRFDHVVLDAPPTGRVVRFLTAGDALAEAARVGPVHDQAERVMATLRAASTRVHVVATPAELPVTEARQALADLAAARLPVGRAVLNRLPAEPPAGELDGASPEARFVARARQERARAERWRGELAGAAEVVVVPEGATPDEVVAALRAAVNP